MMSLFIAGAAGFWSIPAAVACIFIGAAIAGVIMWTKWRKLKSVRFERSACNYVREGSFRITGQKDMFLFSNVSRTPRAQNNNTSSPGRAMSAGGAAKGISKAAMPRGGGASRGGGGGSSGGGGRRR